MEDSAPMPLRRDTDHHGHRRLFRFVPDRADVKSAVTDFRSDLKELKTDVKDLGQNLAVVKGQTAVSPTRGR